MTALSIASSLINVFPLLILEESNIKDNFLSLLSDKKSAIKSVNLSSVIPGLI